MPDLSSLHPRLAVLALVLGLTGGCTRHTSEVWNEDGARRTYEAQSLGVVFLSERRIAVWCSAPMPEGRMASDVSGFTPDHVYVTYQTDEDISRATAQVTRVTVSDEVVYEQRDSVLRFPRGHAEIALGDHVVHAHTVGGGRQDPGAKLQVFSSPIIAFRRVLTVHDGTGRYPTTGEKVLATPFAVALDTVDTALLVASAPIWIPLLVLASPVHTR